MYYLKGISALSVLIAMLLPVSPAWGQTGMQLYTSNGCSGCHNNPQTFSAPSPAANNGTTTSWQSRLDDYDNGIEGMYEAARTGTGLAYAMPNCGSDLGDDAKVQQFAECKLIIDYMLTAAGISAVTEHYNKHCSRCHNNGVLVNGVNAPIANMESENQADWNTRLTERGGYIEGIYTAILEPAETSELSYTNMCASVEDEQCRQITDYMIETLAGVSIVRESVVRDLYNTNCSRCHNTGVSNAPIANMEPANQANWKNRLKERDGIEGIYTSIGSTLAWMCASVETAECEQIADYMIETLAGVSTEPEPSGTQIKLKLLLEGAINSSSE